MIDTQRGSCAVLDIVEAGDGPDGPELLREELVALVARTAFDAGIDAPTVLDDSAHRVVLGFAPQPAHSRLVDGFLDALAAALDRRNSGLEPEDRLRLGVTVDTASGRPDRSPASSLSAKVLAATPASSLVIEATERWYTAAATPDVTYRRVHSRLDRFWLRVPGRSTVPGLAPTELAIDPRPGGEVPPMRSPGHRGWGAMSVTVNGNHYGDNINDSKIVFGSPEAARGSRNEFPTGEHRTGGMRLEGTRAEKLRTALVTAYPSFDEFAMMLREKLERNLHSLASPNHRLDLVVSQAIERARTEGWIDKLVTAAFLGNPGNQALRQLIQTGFCDEAYAMLAAIEDPTGPVTRLWPQAGLLTDLVADASGDAARPWSGTTLERIFRKAAAFQDVLPFASRLLSVAGRVCQVRVGSGGGTGFLVGPDLVLTSHHVVVDVINGQTPRSDVQCVFDHHVGDDGRVHEGVAFELASGDGWLVEASPPSEVEEQVHPTRPPTTGELDYALIRLAEPAGRSTSLDGRTRGWLRLLDPTPELTPDLPLLIVQHPRGLPLKLAMADKGVGAVIGGGTRVTYEVNTERGSSGSPCLTFDLQLVALHQSGHAEHNVGIPISTIVAHLGEVGRSALRGT